MAGLLAGLDAEVVALALLFVVVAGVVVLRPLLQSIFAGAPWPISWLGQNLENGLAAFGRAITPMAESSLWILGSTIYFLQTTWSDFVNAAPALARAVYASSWRLVMVTLPHELGLLQSTLEQAITAARAYALEQALEAARTAATALSGLEARMVAGIAAARLEALQAVQQAEYEAAQLAGKVAADAAALSQADRAFTVEQVRAAEGHADDLFSQSVAITAAAEAALRSDLGGEAQALHQALSGGVSRLEQEISTTQALAAGSIAGALATAMAAVKAIEDSPCMQQCDVLGNLAAELSGLDVGLLVALVAGAASDPQGFEDEVTTALAPVAEGFQQAIRALVAA